MEGAEIEQFIARSRTATVATIGPRGLPHLVAMWYAVIDSEIWIETKAKSQKVANLRRDGRASILIEDGFTYDTLRGVALEGTAEISEELDDLWRVGTNMYERYTGPYSDDKSALIEGMIHKRVAVRFVPERTRSWDHRKLAMPETRISGSTAQFLRRL